MIMIIIIMRISCIFTAGQPVHTSVDKCEYESVAGPVSANIFL